MPFLFVWIICTKNIFQTADWPWVFSHVIRISRCKWSSTFVFLTKVDSSELLRCQDCCTEHNDGRHSSLSVSVSPSTKHCSTDETLIKKAMILKTTWQRFCRKFILWPVWRVLIRTFYIQTFHICHCSLRDWCVKIFKGWHYSSVIFAFGVKILIPNRQFDVFLLLLLPFNCCHMLDVKQTYPVCKGRAV